MLFYVTEKLFITQHVFSRIQINFQVDINVSIEAI